MNWHTSRPCKLVSKYGIIQYLCKYLRELSQIKSTISGNTNWVATFHLDFDQLSISDCKKTEFGISYKGFDVIDNIDHEMSHPEMCREQCFKINASYFEYLLPNPQTRLGSCKGKTSDAGREPQAGKE